jgi:hypothetical protein
MGRLGRRLALMLFLIGGITFVFALIRYREWLLHRPLDWWVAIFTIFGSMAALAGLMPRGDRTGIARFLRRPQPPTADEIATARKNLHAALSGAWSDDVSEAGIAERGRSSAWLISRCGSGSSASTPRR